MGRVKTAKRVTTSEFPILDSLGLIACPIKGDGNCLFRALSDQLFGDETHHGEIRQNIVKFLDGNAARFSGFVGEFNETFEQYISRMAQDGCFGGHMEIVACAELYKRRVVIYQAETLFVVNPLSLPETDYKNMVHIVYHTWEHYSSARPKAGPFHGPVAFELPQIINYVKSNDRGSTQSEEVPQWKVDIVTRSVPDADENNVRKLLQTMGYEEVVEKLLMEQFSDDNDEIPQNTQPETKSSSLLSPPKEDKKPRGLRKGCRRAKHQSKGSIGSVGSVASSSSSAYDMDRRSVRSAESGTKTIGSSNSLNSNNTASSSGPDTPSWGTKKNEPKMTGKQKREERKRRLWFKKVAESNAIDENDNQTTEELKAKIIHI